MPDHELIQLPEQPLELRDLERREVAGRIIPYGEQIQVRGRPESFTLGALSDIPASNIRLLAHHDQLKPIGKALTLEEREDGAYATFRVSKTALGDEMLELAQDGVLGFSPGFLAGTQRSDGTHTKLKALPEVSLVTFGAYKGAQVLAVREEHTPMSETPTTTNPGLEAIEVRLDELTTTMSRMESVVNAPAPKAPRGGPAPLDWFRAMLEAKAGNGAPKEALATRFDEFKLETRELEDITGTVGGSGDISGLMVEDYIASQLVNVIDSRRYLFSRLGSFPMPRSGFAKIPVVTQHTLVDVRSGQKEPANSRKMIVTMEAFEAEWYDGAVDIALEAILTSELGVLEMVWNDLLTQYARATELGVVTKLNTGGYGFSYTGSALDTSDYAGFAADVATAAMEVLEGSGQPADSLAVTSAQWPILVGMVDASDRRQFAPIGATNSDASVGFTSQSFTLPGGIEVFHAPGLDAAILTNRASLRVADSGPIRVEATNVELMGRDLGILGRVMFVPRIPAGVVVFGADPDAS